MVVHYAHSIHIEISHTHLIYIHIHVGHAHDNTVTLFIQQQFKWRSLVVFLSQKGVYL